MFANFSETILERFINTIKFNDMNISIWESFCERLLPSRKSSQKIEKRYLNLFKEFKPENDGIMHYLTKQTGGNIHNNGTIQITSNSICGGHQPRNLVDYNNNNLYYSQNDKDIFVCFDFKKRRIQLSHYSIKSYVNSQNSDHLRNWMIEASNDGKSWIEIDRHPDDPTLNGPSKEKTFKVSNKRNQW